MTSQNVQFYLPGTFSVQKYEFLYSKQHVHVHLGTHVSPHRQAGKLASWDLESTFLHLEPHI